MPGLETVGEYTREAGVRTLERKIGAMCRAVAVQVAEALSAQGQYDGKGEESSLSL